MKAPKPHPREAERLVALEKACLHCTPAEKRFDIITETARKAFNVPIALFSLVTATRQWFKSASGLPAPETPRAVSFCGHTILTPDLFVVPDALNDPRFADNPLVTGEPKIRFYAGCPIYGANELPLGTLCIIDTQPRRLDIFDRQRLKALGNWLTTEVRNRGLSERELRVLSQGGPEDNPFIDPMSKCWNRAATEVLLAHALETAETGQQISALMIDFVLPEGHWADQELEAVGKAQAWMGNTLRQLLPEECILATVEANRFLVVLPGTAAEDAGAVSGRLVSELEQHGCPVLDCAPRVLVQSDLLHNGRLKSEVLLELSEDIKAVSPGTYQVRKAPQSAVAQPPPALTATTVAGG